MTLDLSGLDPVLESRIRVGVLALLANGDTVDYTHLRDRLEVTDGNLATHLKRLDEAGYVRMKKSFIGRRPNTAYAISPRGRTALERHVSLLSRALGKGGSK